MVTLEDPLIQSTKAQLKKLNTSMPTSTSSSNSKLLFNPTNPLKRQRFQLRSNHITRILKKKKPNWNQKHTSTNPNDNTTTNNNKNNNRSKRCEIFTRLLQLMHLRLGGSFMRPLMIFSFLSSSFLLPISKTIIITRKP